MSYLWIHKTEPSTIPVSPISEVIANWDQESTPRMHIGVIDPLDVARVITKFARKTFDAIDDESTITDYLIDGEHPLSLADEAAGLAK